MPNLSRSYGGPVTALTGFVSAGALRGVRSTVVGPRCSRDDLAWLRTEMPTATFVAESGPEQGPWTGAPSVLPAVQRLLAEVDVVHVHGLLNATSSGASRLAIRSRRPVVIGPFGTMSPYTFSHRRALAKRVYFSCFDAPNLRRASALHFTTPAERAEASWHHIDGNGRSYVVPPPYPTSGMVRAPGAIAPRDSPVVLFLGRLDPKKGIDVLLDSWGQVITAFPNAELRIAGSGETSYSETLRRRVAALGSRASSVRFLGFVGNSDKDRQLDEAFVLVLPSRHENFGIAVLDGVAAGVPVVVSPGVHLAPWVDEQSVGRVSERSPAAVGRAIVEVLSDDALRARVAAQGRDAVARAFSPDAVAPALHAMYEGALARGVESR